MANPQFRATPRDPVVGAPFWSADAEAAYSKALAPSTRRSYAYAQNKFVDFFRHLGKTHPLGSTRPAEEMTLCLFSSSGANSVHSSTINVYLSAVRAMHIKQDFMDSLLNCPCLRQVVWGILT